MTATVRRKVSGPRLPTLPKADALEPALRRRGVRCCRIRSTVPHENSEVGRGTGLRDFRSRLRISLSGGRCRWLSQASIRTRIRLTRATHRLCPRTPRRWDISRRVGQASGLRVVGVPAAADLGLAGAVRLLPQAGSLDGGGPVGLVPRPVVLRHTRLAPQDEAILRPTALVEVGGRLCLVARRTTFHRNPPTRAVMVAASQVIGTQGAPAPNPCSRCSSPTGSTS